MLLRQFSYRRQNGTPAEFVLAIVGFSLLLTSCDTLSLQPLSSETEKTIAEPAVIGSWKNSEDATIWIVTEKSPAVYSVVQQGKSTDLLKVRLARIGQVLFADFQPAEQEFCQIPGHLFARVQVDSSKMQIAWVDFKWLERQVQPPSFLGHQFAAFGEDNNLILTATTAELRAYLEKVIGMSKAFQEDQIFRRVVPANR